MLWQKLNGAGFQSLKQAVYPPACLNEMLNLSSILTKWFPEMRAGWRVIGNWLIFGELTLFSDGGFGTLDTATDERLGALIDLKLAYGD